MRTAVMFLLMCIANSAQTNTLQTTAHHLTLLQDRVTLPLPTDPALQSGAWQATIAELEPTQQVLQIQRWLEQLAKRSVASPAQSEWVKSMLADPRELTVANPDHPHTLMSVVSLAKQAKATQYIWRVKRLTAMLEQDWQQAQLNWPVLLNNLAAEQSDALVQWIDSLTSAEAHAVAEHFENYGLAYVGDSNRILARIALVGRSSTLARALLQRRADEYSHRFVQQTVEAFDDYALVDLLGRAISNPALSSQALNLLAKHHSTDMQAQKYLEQAIENPELQWQAVAALEFMPENSFRTALIEKIEQYDLPSRVLLERLPSQGGER